MKVGDLVRFQQQINGTGGLIGIVVAPNGPEAVDVMWFGSQVRWRHQGNEFACEMKCFLEVISEEDT